MIDLVFLALMVVTVGGAIIALEAEEIIYGAIALAGSLFGVAALFFLLEAPYVAVFQITVYVGAIAVLILFTVMLVRQEKWTKEVSGWSIGKLFGALTGGAIAFALIVAVSASSSYFPQNWSPQNSVAPSQIGKLISTTYAPVLEVLALVLAASVVGALTLSRVDRETVPG
ncbi:MAG TPA: NADH-quinone oxidoreductase subunit J [Nitrososphaerales archaeon]|nr:NADH-quinone oxidoreductase subunit J [Nitrososphaerales archaeon]